MKYGLWFKYSFSILNECVHTHALLFNILIKNKINKFFLIRTRCYDSNKILWF